jgi:magnesium transporter
MAMTIQALRSTEPSLPWYLDELKREVLTALYLGCACGGVVGMIVWIWRGAVLAALVIGSSITFSLVMACVLGLSIPTLLHALKLDPKIAAGPITLALTDIITLLFYFSLGAAVLTKAA